MANFAPATFPVMYSGDRKKNKATNEQILALRREIACNPHMYSYNNPNSSINWEQLTQKLNALGTEKTVSQWRKSWKDQEKHVLPVNNVYQPVNNTISKVNVIRNTPYIPTNGVQSPMHLPRQHTADGRMQCRPKPVIKENVKIIFKKPETMVANPMTKMSQLQTHLPSTSLQQSNPNEIYQQLPGSKVEEQVEEPPVYVIHDESTEEEELNEYKQIKQDYSTSEWDLPNIPDHQPKQLKLEMENNNIQEEDVGCVGFSLNVTSNGKVLKKVKEAKKPVNEPNQTLKKNIPAHNSLAALSVMEQHNTLIRNIQESMDNLTRRLQERSEEESTYQATALSFLQEISTDLKELVAVCTTGISQ